MSRRPLIVCVFLTALILIADRSNAGVVIEERVRDREGKTSRIVLSCAGDRLRTDASAEGLTTIIDLRDDRIVLIDHRSRSYVETALSLWEKEVSNKLKEENPGVRPTARSITVRPSGERATINGFKTRKILVLADGELIEEHWMAGNSDMREADRVMDKANQIFSREFRSEIKEGQEIQNKLKPYGFSILVKDHTLTSGLKGIDVLEVKKIEHKELKDEAFLPPAGYERVVPRPEKK